MQQSNENTLQAQDFAVTDAALKRIAYLLSDEPEGSAFIIEVQGGGCSGFQYAFDMKTKAAEPENIVIERNGARVLVDVDADSLEIVKGSTLDFHDDLSGAGFEITNPNATASCGCGNSFSVGF